MLFMHSKRARPWGPALSAILAVAILAACSGSPADPTPLTGQWTVDESFEDGLGVWERGADVPPDADAPGQTVEWSIECSANQASTGIRSAELYIDGKHDDGTIWLVRSVDVPADRQYNVHLSFDLWSDSESFNTLTKAAAFAGHRAPETEGDFDVSQPGQQVTGWKTYEYTFEVSSGTEGQVWLAVGISVSWETKVTQCIDNISAQLQMM